MRFWLFTQNTHKNDLRLKIKIRGFTQRWSLTYFLFKELGKLEDVDAFPVISLSVICLLDPCRTLAFFVF
jgi:hypothetical protein